MFAMPDSKYTSIKPYAEKAVSPTAKVVTDGGTNLIRLRELFCHEAYRETEGEVHEVVTKVLPWVHIVTGECRSAIGLFIRKWIKDFSNSISTSIAGSSIGDSSGTVSCRSMICFINS